MEFKDYYKIMGLSETADAAEIKRTYRKLARKYHPDVSKETNAEERFKEIGEAYEVLKDKEKRATYDNVRKGGWHPGQDYRPPPGSQRQSRSQGTADFDTDQFSDFFSSLFGGGFAQQQSRRQDMRRRGEDQHYKLAITLEESFTGATRSIQLRVQEVDQRGFMVEKNRALNVKIPKGIQADQQIRLREQGSPGAGGGPNGDLFLEIEFVPHSLFSVDKKDIYLTLPITPWEAALGGSVTVPTLAGKVDVKIPPNSQSGQKLRLKGRGLADKSAGDQIIQLNIVIPRADTDIAKALYQQMAKELAFDPREQFKNI